MPGKVLELRDDILIRSEIAFAATRRLDRFLEYPAILELHLYTESATFASVNWSTKQLPSIKKVATQ